MNEGPTTYKHTSAGIPPCIRLPLLLLLVFSSDQADEMYSGEFFHPPASKVIHITVDPLKNIPA